MVAVVQEVVGPLRAQVQALTAERDEWHRRHNVVAETYEAEVGRLRAALEQIDRVICTCGHVDPCPTHAAARFTRAALTPEPGEPE